MKHIANSWTEEYTEYRKKYPWDNIPIGMIKSRWEYQECPTKITIAECCGSFLCPPENFKEAVGGVVVCFTPEQMVLPKDHGEFTYHQVKGDGDWINIKLLHSEEAHSPKGWFRSTPKNYGNVYSLYTGFVRNHTDITKDHTSDRYLYKAYPDGLYLSVLTKTQVPGGELTYLLGRGFTLEWESPAFSNHNYSNDPNRLTMYVMRKGEKR